MDYLKTKLHWEKTNDPLYPYTICSVDKNFKLCLNDYPEEPMYTLIIDGEINESFDDWPEAWTRSKKN
jgi:hypothetical protein